MISKQRETKSVTYQIPTPRNSRGSALSSKNDGVVGSSRGRKPLADTDHIPPSRSPSKSSKPNSFNKENNAFFEASMCLLKHGPTEIIEQSLPIETKKDPLAKYLLPNLLESHLRRQKLLQLEKENPNLLHTRILFANYHSHQVKKIGQPQEDLSDGNDKIFRKEAKKSELKKKRQFKVLNLGPMKFTGRTNNVSIVDRNMKRNSMWKDTEQSSVFGESPIRQTRSTVKSTPRVTVFTDDSYDCFEKIAFSNKRSSSTTRQRFNHGISSISEPESNKPNHSLLQTNYTPIARQTKKAQPENIVPSHLQPSYRSPLSVRSSRYSDTKSNNEHKTSETGEPIKKKKKPIPRLNLHPETEIRILQQKECEAILAAFSEKGITISRNVIERAILVPEDILHLAPKVSKNNQSKPKRIPMHMRHKNLEESSDSDNDEKSKRRHPPLSLNAIVVRPYLRHADSESLLTTNSGKTNNWWSKDEYKQLKMGLEDRIYKNKQKKMYKITGAIEREPSFNAYVTSRPPTAETSTLQTKHRKPVDSMEKFPIEPQTSIEYATQLHAVISGRERMHQGNWFPSELPLHGANNNRPSIATRQRDHFHPLSTSLFQETISERPSSAIGRLETNCFSPRISSIFKREQTSPLPAINNRERSKSNGDEVMFYGQSNFTKYRPSVL